MMVHVVGSCMRVFLPLVRMQGGMSTQIDLNFVALLRTTTLVSTIVYISWLGLILVAHHCMLPQKSITEYTGICGSYSYGYVTATSN